MIQIAASIALVCGLVSIAGGIHGWLSGSTVSLVAGGAIGIVLVVAGYLMFKGTLSWAPGIALVAALALAGRFLPIFLKNTNNVWPAAVMAFLGVLTAVAQVLAMTLGRK